MVELSGFTHKQKQDLHRSLHGYRAEDIVSDKIYTKEDMDLVIAANASLVNGLMESFQNMMTAVVKAGEYVQDLRKQFDAKA